MVGHERVFHSKTTSTKPSTGGLKDTQKNPQANRIVCPQAFRYHHKTGPFCHYRKDERQPPKQAAGLDDPLRIHKKSGLSATGPCTNRTRPSRSRPEQTLGKSGGTDRSAAPCVWNHIFTIPKPTATTKNGTNCIKSPFLSVPAATKLCPATTPEISPPNLC